MDFEIKSYLNLYEHLEKMFKSEVIFDFDDYQVKESVKELKFFLNNINNNCFVGIESKYVDKLYRDEFYHYYSSKLVEYKRDCIRLSFFTDEFSINDFHSIHGAEKLQNNFRGFLVLRPTSPKIIGRNALHPTLFNNNFGHICAVTSNSASINGLKLIIEAFPHSSQDGEFMVCAETTLWSIMEYFAQRYPEYKPILPKRIHSLLSNTSMQRQVPSIGLNGLQISYALKEFGFGVKLYTKNSYGESDLLNMIKIYVESGIPVIVAISNTKGVNHVVNIVGRTDFKTVTNFKFSPILTLKSGSVLYDYFEQTSDYLSIDDNLQPYMPTSLLDPACNYVSINSKWKDCKIIAAIVPLHPRVYMEADRAKNLAIQILKAHDQNIPIPNLVLRVLLSSSRSFKQSISMNPDLNDVTKTLIVNIDMPKFVWIAEVGTINSFLKGKATGMILMDATEPKKIARIAYLLENAYIGKINGVHGNYTLPLQPFNIHHNLKHF